MMRTNEIQLVVDVNVMRKQIMKHLGVMCDEDTSIRNRSGHKYAACIL
jgi:hypothetical protein